MKTYWVYAEDTNEAGTVVDADSPQLALTEALALGFDPEDGDVWAYELGPLHSLGRVKP